MPCIIHVLVRGALGVEFSVTHHTQTEALDGLCRPCAGPQSAGCRNSSIASVRIRNVDPSLIKCIHVLCGSLLAAKLTIACFALVLVIHNGLNS